MMLLFSGKCFACKVRGCVKCGKPNKCLACDEHHRKRGAKCERLHKNDGCALGKGILRAVRASYRTVCEGTVILKVVKASYCMIH